jgi:predicted amidophosphoribosyltransferase
MTDHPICRACGESFARIRGLCNKCYGVAAYAVRNGQTTWAKLEAEGKVLPPAVKGGADWRQKRKR